MRWATATRRKEESATMQVALGQLRADVSRVRMQLDGKAGKVAEGQIGGETMEQISVRACSVAR